MESINPTNQEQAPANTELSPALKTQIAEEQAIKNEELERSVVTAADIDNNGAPLPANEEIQQTTSAELDQKEVVSPVKKESQHSNKKRKLSQISGSKDDNQTAGCSVSSSKKIKLNSGEIVEKKSQKSAATSQHLTQSEMEAVIQDIDKLSVTLKTPTVHDVEQAPPSIEQPKPESISNSKSKETETAVANINPAVSTAADVEMPEVRQVSVETQDQQPEKHQPTEEVQQVDNEPEDHQPAPEVNQRINFDALIAQAILCVFQDDGSSENENKNESLSNSSSADQQVNNLSMETQNDVNAVVDVDHQENTIERSEMEPIQDQQQTANSKQTKIEESAPAPASAAQ